MRYLISLAFLALPTIVFAQFAEDEFCEYLVEIQGMSEEELATYQEWSEEYVGALMELIEESDAFQEFPNNWARHSLRVQVASCYISGKGTERDVNKAMAILEEPAEAGFSQAMHILASLRVFKTDDPKLQRLGFAALEREYVGGGSAFAAGKVGWAYQKGLGVEPDQEKAIELYEHAAKSGMTYWQYLLAHAYEKGYLGLDVNQVRSAHWLAFKPKVHVALYECWVATYYADGTFPENEELRAKYQKICEETDIADVWER